VGINDAAAAQLRLRLAERGENYQWLALAAKVPYKRVLDEVKNGKRKLSLETAERYGDALGISLPQLVAAA
jgi:hypothetical protein